MLLVQYSKGNFLDLERVEHIGISQKVIVTLAGDNESYYTVGEQFKDDFFSAVNGFDSGAVILGRLSGTGQ